MQEAREAVGDVQFLSLSTTDSNSELFSELQDRVREDLALELSAKRWNVALREFDKGVTANVHPARDESGSASTRNQGGAADDDEFGFSGVVVRDGNLYGEATNRDSRARSAILTVTFYDENGEIVGTGQTAIDTVRPGRSRTFTILNVPGHARHKIEIATLI